MSVKNADPIETPEPPSEADRVADYLRAHPDFFDAYEDVLATLIAPGKWTGDRVVDFQKILLERRMSEIEEMRNCAMEVIETSRTNMSVQSRTHAAVLAVLGATDFDHLVHVVTEDLPLLLDVDVVVLAFEAGGKPLAELVSSNIRHIYEGAVDQLVGIDRDVRLLRDIDDDGTIFGGAAALVRSAAIARLRPGTVTPAGIVALGTRGSVFQPGQGTELITFLARVVESAVRRWQESPA